MGQPLATVPEGAPQPETKPVSDDAAARVRKGTQSLIDEVADLRARVESADQDLVAAQCALRGAACAADEHAAFERFRSLELERKAAVRRLCEIETAPSVEVRIDLDLNSIRQHGLSVGELVQRIDAANLDLDLGAVRGDVLRYDVRSASRFRDVEIVRNLDIGVPGLHLRCGR